MATLAVQKGATDLSGLIGGAVNTAVSLTGHRENDLDTPFIPVPGCRQRKKTTPLATLSAAMSEISTVQGFLHAVLEEKIAVGLEVVRVSARGPFPLSITPLRSGLVISIYLGKALGFGKRRAVVGSLLGARLWECLHMQSAFVVCFSLLCRWRMELLDANAFVVCPVQEDKRVKMRVGEQLQLTEDGIHTGVWFEHGREKRPGGRLVQFFVEGRLGRCLVEVKEYGHGLPLLPPFGLLVDQSRLRISVTIENTGEVIVLRRGPSEKLTVGVQY